MVFSENAYKEVFPDVKPSAPVKKVESMIEDDPVEDIKESPEVVKDSEDELTVEAPEPKTVQEGQNDDTGTDDTVN